MVGWWTNVSWRWVFYINIPLAIIVLVILFWRVPESRDEEIGKELDWLGAVLVTLGLAGITYGLVESANHGLTSQIVIGSVLGGIIALVAFVFVESRAKTPLMDLSIFRSPTFTGANLLTLIPVWCTRRVLYSSTTSTLSICKRLHSFSMQVWLSYHSPLCWRPSLPGQGGLVHRYGAKLPSRSSAR